MAKSEYQIKKEKEYPQWNNIQSRELLTYSEQTDPYYENKIGQVIKVKYFMSFGAWDEQGRWICYYDLSTPIM